VISLSAPHPSVALQMFKSIPWEWQNSYDDGTQLLLPLRSLRPLSPKPTKGFWSA